MKKGGMTMRALLIGGTGTISTAVTAELLHGGWEVTLLNRGTHSVPGTRHIRCDRQDAAALKSALDRESRYDCVIDAICYDPEEARALVAAVTGKTTQLIFISTVDVHKKPAARYPITEDAEIGADPRFVYAHKKVACERIVKEAAASGAFELTILRPAATYSDLSTPIAFVGSGLNQLWRILMNKPVILLGDGMSLWTYSHRDDVGPAIARAAGNARTFGRDYTVCGDEAMTWRQHLDEAARALGAQPPRYLYVPTDALCRLEPERCSWSEYNFMYDNIFDTTRAKRDLGYRQTIDWAEGTRRMVAHRRAHAPIRRDDTDALVDAVIDAYQRGVDEAVGQYTGK